MNNWTFDFMAVTEFGNGLPWHRSAKRFSTWQLALEGAKDWMTTCYENDWPIVIRLVDTTNKAD